MSVFGGNNVNTDGLIAFLDMQSDRCKGVDTNNWKLYTPTTESGDFSVTSGIYNTTTKDFTTDGTNEYIEIPKLENTQLGWGKTISMLINPSEESFIFNDASSISLYFNENKKPILFLAPPFYNVFSSLNSILITSNNEIYIGNGDANYNVWVWKLNLDGELLSMKKNIRPNSPGTHSRGKWIEKDGYIWMGYVSGATKNYDPSEKTNYDERILAPNLSAYYGAIDIDDDNIYHVGSLVHSASKIPISNPAGIVSFGLNLNTYYRGSRSSGTDGFDGPLDIAAGTTYVFIADKYNHRIMVLDKSTWQYSGQFGSYGSDNSHFNQPVGVFIDNGLLYICDYNNSRIQIYNESTQTYSDTISLPFKPTMLSMNSDYIAIVGNNILYVIDKSTHTSVLTKNFYPKSYYNSYYLISTKFYDNTFYILNDSRYLYTINDDLTYDYQKQLNYGASYPWDLAIDDDYYYIAPYYDYYMYMVDKITNTYSTIGNGSGTGDGYFGAANNYGITSDDNYIYVSDEGNDRIQYFNKTDLSYAGQFGSYGSGDDNFNTPRGIEIYDGKIYICDYSNHRIKIYNQSDKSYISSITGVTLPKKVRIYNNRIYILRSTTIEYRDITTHSLIYSKSLTSNDVPSHINGAENFDVGDGKLVIASQANFSIFDADDLSFESTYRAAYYPCTLDQTPESDSFLVDIVFTEDYKVKMYVNGVESTTQTFDADTDFSTAADVKLGYFRDAYGQSSYKWLAWYDKARTLEEHTEDFNNLQKRFQ